jgi:hypothetical protein
MNGAHMAWAFPIASLRILPEHVKPREIFANLYLVEFVSKMLKLLFLFKTNFRPYVDFLL